MQFSYFGKNNELVKLSIKTEQTWIDQNVNNDFLDSIFSIIDDGNGIVSEKEHSFLNKLLQMADDIFNETANDGIIDNNEIETLINDIKTKKINLQSMKKDFGIVLKEQKIAITEYNNEDKILYEIEPSEYSMTSLTQKYPQEEGYQIEKNQNYIYIHKEGASILKISYGKNGDIESLTTYGNSEKTYYYKKNKLQKYDICYYNSRLGACIAHFNKNGDGLFFEKQKEYGTEYYDAQLNLVKIEYNDKFKSLHDDFKNSIKNRDITALNKLIDQVDPKSLIFILEGYRSSNSYETTSCGGIDLITDIDIVLKNTINKQEKMNLINKIYQKLINYAKDKNIYTKDVEDLFNSEEKYINSDKNSNFINFEFIINRLIRRIQSKNSNSNSDVNEKIDNEYKQGNTGDCWLIATITAIRNNPKLKEQLEGQISKDIDGNITVFLKGINKSYKISKEELKGATELSSGDLDVRAIEIAVRKYLVESNWHNGNITSRNLAGDDPNKAIGIILGTKPSDNKVDIIKKLMKGNATCIVSAKENTTFKSGDIDGADFLYTKHAYTAVNADEKYVYLINPHDTSKQIKISHKLFLNFFKECIMVDNI